MNVLFISISSLPHVSEHGISLDLLHEFRRQGHNVFIVCALEKRDNQETFLSEEDGCKILRVKIGNNKKANIIEKGFTTILLPRKYIGAIKQYYSSVHFDLVLYPTPPITQVKTVQYIKKRDNAQSYLLLKDIFPQNAVDIGMMSKSGLKGLLYRYFRNIERQLYQISDFIGCMSQANIDYLLQHNPEIDSSKVEICPNSVEVMDLSCDADERLKLRRKYGIPTDKKVFVYGGNLGKPQDIPFIIDCLRASREIEVAYFLIVGNGTEYGKIQKYVTDETPINVKLLKQLPREDYDKMIGCCDIGLIFLDHRFTIPNFPSRLLSYMAAKLPVLACTDKNTDVGDVIVNGDFGWWCKSDSIDSFRTLVNQICNSDYEKKGLNGYNYLNEHYSVNKAYNIIERKINEV